MQMKQRNIGHACESEGKQVNDLKKFPLSPINHLQFTGFDIDDEAVYGDLREIGAVANDVDDFAYVDMDVIECAQPIHQAHARWAFFTSVAGSLPALRAEAATCSK